MSRKTKIDLDEALTFDEPLEEEAVAEEPVEEPKPEEPKPESVQIIVSEGPAVNKPVLSARTLAEIEQGKKMLEKYKK